MRASDDSYLQATHFITRIGYEEDISSNKMNITNIEQNRISHNRNRTKTSGPNHHRTNNKQDHKQEPKYKNSENVFTSLFFLPNVYCGKFHWDRKSKSN